MTDMTLALAGNPNSGKTTLFNALTGARQHVGNYPGVTVEKKEGLYVHDGRRLKIVDLPGTYSLTAYSLEEVVARDFLVNERPAAVIDIVDAANLERNLYLTLQFMELGVPVVLKLSAPSLVHKTEAGGVKLNLVDAEAVGQAFTDLADIASKHVPQGEAWQVVVMKQAAAGEEVLLGGRRDEAFGPVVAFGAGGEVEYVFEHGHHAGAYVLIPHRALAFQLKGTGIQGVDRGDDGLWRVLDQRRPFAEQRFGKRGARGDQRGIRRERLAGA